MRRAFLPGAAALFLFAACDFQARQPQPTADAAELRTAREQLAAANASLLDAKEKLAVKTQELALMKDVFADLRGQMEMLLQQAAARTDELKKAKADIERLQRDDAHTFAQISLHRQQGDLTTAAILSQKLIDDFPQSPWAAIAKSSKGELSTEIDARQTIIDTPLPAKSAKSRQRDLRTRIANGAVTGEDLAPLLKKKASRGVVALLGKPDQLSPGGAEWRYLNKAISSETGERDQLIITFDGGAVSSLRVGYLGRRIYP